MAALTANKKAELTHSSDGAAVKGALSVETVRKLYTAGPRFNAGEYCIDLTEINEIDSAGLALLVYWKQLAIKQQSKLSYKNLPAQVISMARISNLEELLDVAS